MSEEKTPGLESVEGTSPTASPYRAPGMVEWLKYIAIFAIFAVTAGTALRGIGGVAETKKSGHGTKEKSHSDSAHSGDSHGSTHSDGDQKSHDDAMKKESDPHSEAEFGQPVDLEAAKETSVKFVLTPDGSTVEGVVADAETSRMVMQVAEELGALGSVEVVEGLQPANAEKLGTAMRLLGGRKITVRFGTGGIVLDGDLASGAERDAILRSMMSALGPETPVVFVGKVAQEGLPTPTMPPQKRYPRNETR